MDKVKDLDISIVFINAGIMPVGHMENIPVEVISELLDINVYQYGMLHKLLIEKLLERSKERKRSLLMGTASCTWLRQV